MCRGLGTSLQGNREYLQQRLETIGFRVLPGQVRLILKGYSHSGLPQCISRNSSRSIWFRVSGKALSVMHSQATQSIPGLRLAAGISHLGAAIHPSRVPGPDTHAPERHAPDAMLWQGTYFLVADMRPLARAPGGGVQNGLDVGSSSGVGAGDASSHGGGGGHETDVEFCQRLTVEAGVTLIPVRHASPLLLRKDSHALRCMRA